MRCQECHLFIPLAEVKTCPVCLAVLCKVCHGKHGNLHVLEQGGNYQDAQGLKISRRRRHAKD